VTEGTILHWPIIHKKALLASGRTVEGGLGNEPPDLEALIGIRYCQQMLLQPLVKYHLNALTQVRCGERLRVHTTVHGQCHMHCWRGQG
jgi:hypothetical protein